MEEWIYVGEEPEWLSDEEAGLLRLAIVRGMHFLTEDNEDTVLEWARGVRRDADYLRRVLAGEIVLVVYGQRVGFFAAKMDA